MADSQAGSQALETHLEGLKTGVQVTEDRLKAVVDSNRSSTVQVTTFVPQGNMIGLSGTATSYQEVLKFANELDSSPYFTEVIVNQASAVSGVSSATSTPSGSPRIVSFKITATPSQPPAPSPSTDN